MKKIWLALAGMILAFSASAAQFTDGKQYITLASHRYWSSSRSIAHTVTSSSRCCMSLTT